MPHQPPPNYFSRRVQTRLLLLVFLFMTVLMLMSEARNPVHYQWLWSTGNTVPATTGPAPVGAHRKPPVAEADPSSDASSVAGDDRQLPTEETAWQNEAGRLPRLVSPEVVDAIQDDRVLRPEEYEAWFRIWRQLQARTPDQDTGRRPGRVSYTQLFAQPDEYRGRLISVRGRVRLAYYSPAAANAFAIKGYYVFWVQVHDDLVSQPAGSDLVLAVYCLELPAGFPAVQERESAIGPATLDEWMQFTGVLFKRWVYRSQGGPELVPLLLGQVTDWTPAPTTPPAPRGAPAAGWLFPILILLAATIGITIAICVYRTSLRLGTHAIPGTPTPAALPTFAHDHVRGGVRESLRDLSAGRAGEIDSDEPQEA